MGIQTLNEVKDLDGLYSLLYSSNEGKIVNGWFGKTVVIGDVKFSESNLCKKIQQLKAETNDTSLQLGLCAKRLIQIKDNEQDCSLPKKLCQKMFSLITGFFGYKNTFDVRDIRKFELDFIDAPWCHDLDIKKTWFVEHYGEQFPQLREVYATCSNRPSTTEVDAHSFFKALIKEVSFNQIENIFKKLTGEGPFENDFYGAPTLNKKDLHEFIRLLDKKFIAKKIAKDCGLDTLSDIFIKLLSKEVLSTEEVESLKESLKAEDCKIKFFLVLKSVDELLDTKISQLFLKEGIALTPKELKKGL